MPKVTIVTDSAAALDPAIVQRYSIKVLPLSVHLGSEVYREGIDISAEQFLSRLGKAGSFPTISSPPINDFYKFYEETTLAGGSVLSLHVSGQLERVVETARKAGEGFLGRNRVEVMDSETISLGQGILVKAAAEAAAAGESLDEIVRLIRGMIPHVYSIFFVETLDYLERRGRIGVAQAILGSMLEVKPILTIEDGDLIPMEKVRSNDKAIEKLVEFIAEFSRIDQLLILSDPSRTDTGDLLEQLKLVFGERELPTFTYGPSLAAHLGPAAMGAIIYEGI